MSSVHTVQYADSRKEEKVVTKGKEKKRKGEVMALTPDISKVNSTAFKL